MDHWDVTVTFDSGLVVKGVATSLEDLVEEIKAIRNRNTTEGDILRIEAS